MTLVWQPGWNRITEQEAADYISAVEAADAAAGSPGGLEPGVVIAFNDFVAGCKSDGIWNAIKACCILAGARTLAGALVPLVGTAPNRYGTEGGWNYNRETGLAGNGTNNYLNSNRNNAADPQNSNHNAAFVTVAASASIATIMGVNDQFSGAPAGGNVLVQSGFSRNRSSTGTSSSIPSSTTGLFGTARASSSFYTLRAASQNFTINVASDGLFSSDVLIFRRQYFENYFNGRISFYSIGESLDLELLDARVTRLMNLITYTQTPGLPDLSVMDIDAAAYIGGGYRAGGTLS